MEQKEALIEKEREEKEVEVKRNHEEATRVSAGLANHLPSMLPALLTSILSIRTKIILTLLYFLSVAIFIIVPSSAQEILPTESSPNIVIFFADNLGYNDVGVFSDNPLESLTPNIDQLASEGKKFNNWNSAASLCSASRAALLTGKYPVRSGVYPAVFKPDAVYGLLPDEVTLAEYLKGYATAIVGKWHLGHRHEFLPINQGFDKWLGIPYHMSGGSINEHICGYDTNHTMWLPLFQNSKIIQQPVDLTSLAQQYASFAISFIEQASKDKLPFFLYVPFSHVHQLCAPKQDTCQWASKAFSRNSPNATFAQNVHEMDWIAGEIMHALDETMVSNNTLVIFTSDNGPWVSEKSCSGSKGPFQGKWLIENVAQSCTACPHDFVPSPTTSNPRRCVYPGREDEYQIEGVHCGEDTGLGSIWEANLRMPSIVRWPNHVPRGTETNELVSTLDVVPTILKIVGLDIPPELDGIDISYILTRNETSISPLEGEDRILFFWRDGFEHGPLPQPYGRFDVVAAKLGRIKAWFYTKSSHYNADPEVYHDPPLLFDTIQDPAEEFPLNPKDHIDTIARILEAVDAHKRSIDWTYPLTMARDAKFLPCADRSNNCRTPTYQEIFASVV